MEFWDRKRAQAWLVPFALGCCAGAAALASALRVQSWRQLPSPTKHGKNAPTSSKKKGRRHMQRGDNYRNCENNRSGDADIFYGRSREVLEEDSVAWLDKLPAGQLPAGSCVITGIPDISELAAEGRCPDAWRVWFQRAAEAVLKRLPMDSVAIFIVTDVKLLKVEGTLPAQQPNQNGNAEGRRYWEWVDKSHIIIQAAAGIPSARLLWHKIVCAGLSDAGGRTSSVASYSHALCFTVGDMQEPFDGAPFPDVSRKGISTYASGFGANFVENACKFVRARGCSLVVDPFCGEGSVLAVANALGMDSLGLEICKRRAKSARELDGEKLLAADRTERVA